MQFPIPGPIGDKARAIADLVKPELPLAAGICVVAGEIIGSGGLPEPSAALLGFLTGFFVSGSAMISNDFFDLEVDRINHPMRPLPSGRITIAELTLLTFIFTAVGFLAAALLGPQALALTIFIWIIGILYNWRYKESGLLGNAMVALSVGWTFIFGGAIVDGLANGMIWIFAALAFVFDLGEEIAGGAMDVKGDDKRSARTIARIYGKRHALNISGLLSLLFVAIGTIPFVMGWLSSCYLAVFLPVDLAVLYLAEKLRASQTDEEGRRRIRQLYLVVTFLVIAFIAVKPVCELAV
ncbi:MAG TPA: UbiA family prenyltransferase [Methanotrichaceae archaeon]|nr:UbiA family prenyltransferase [Methanotrichaceae archaeon]HQI91472.1 UbiA family prenyltransferase [Methanotrichaceae archaeon]HQJ28810.1 UbiA family prenyltransferase [Methanotrichaceae archaeon]